MAERFKLKTVVNNLSVCNFCPGWDIRGYEAYKGQGYKPSMKFDATSVCRIAELEESLGRVPTYNEVALTLGVKIDWPDRLPNECPNKYRGFRDSPISDRK